MTPRGARPPRLLFGAPSRRTRLGGLAKCFLERLALLREPKMVLADKPFGVVTVGAFRNGGQELTVEQIQAILLCFGMIPLGGHAPAFQGATPVCIRTAPRRRTCFSFANVFGRG